MDKPKCKLIGEDGNIFNLLGLASRTLKKADLEDAADEDSADFTGAETWFEKVPGDTTVVGG